MSRPSSRTSSQRSSAWRSRGWVTAVPSCQNVPARSRRRPIARIFSIMLGRELHDAKLRSVATTGERSGPWSAASASSAVAISTRSLGVRARRFSSCCSCSSRRRCSAVSSASKRFLRGLGCAHAASAPVYLTIPRILAGIRQSTLAQRAGHSVGVSDLGLGWRGCTSVHRRRGRRRARRRARAAAHGLRPSA